MILQAHIRTVIWALVICCAHPLLACKYNVRDVGFVDWDPKLYQLTAFTNATTPTTLLDSLRNTSVVLLPDSNVEFVTAPRANGSSSDLVLRSPEGTTLDLSFPTPPSSPSPAEREPSWAFLESIIQSPARQTILDQIVESYAVVVIIESNNPSENEQASRAINNAMTRLQRLMDKLPKAINASPKTFTLSPRQRDAERIFLWSLGVPEDSKDLHVAILYGRGRRIGETLTGTITEDDIYERLAILGQDCECSLDRDRMTGPMIPAAWDQELQKKVHGIAGFDAENPLVKTEVSRIMARGPAKGITPVGIDADQSFDIDTLGYTEIDIEPLDEPEIDPVQNSSSSNVSSVTSNHFELESTSSSPNSFSGLLIASTAIVIATIVGCTLILRRRENTP